MWRQILQLIFGSFMIAQSWATDWTLYKIGGRDYVSIDNLAKFYNLGLVNRANNAFTVISGHRSLRGSAGSVEFYINGLKFNLSYPIAEVDGKLVVSRMDLTKVIVVLIQVD